MTWDDLKKDLTPFRVLLIAVLAFIGYMIYLNHFRYQPDNPDNVLPNVSKAAIEAYVEMAGEQARMRRAMAEAIRKGKITNGTEYKDWFQEQLTPAYLRAYEEFLDMEHKSVIEEKDNSLKSTAASFNDSVADGMERINMRSLLNGPQTSVAN